MLVESPHLLGLSCPARQQSSRRRWGCWYPHIFKLTGTLAGYHLVQQLPRVQTVLVDVCVQFAD